MNYLIIISAIIFFGFAHFIVAMGLFIRFAGNYTKNIYLAHSLERVLQLSSSISLAIFVPLIAFTVEKIFSTKNFITMALLSQFFAASLIFLLIIFRRELFTRSINVLDKSKYKNNKHIVLIVFYFFHRFSKKHNSNICFEIKKIHLKFFYIGFLISFFLGSGFFFSFFLASSYPEYRLTLSQSAIFIHGMGSILQILYADPILGNIIEDKKRLDWWSAFISYLLGKFFAHTIIGIIFLFNLY